MTKNHLHVLMMEDDDGDILLTRESLKESKLHINLDTVPNGLEGLKFLRKEEPYTKSQIPDLILLDLNMPVMDGRQVLEEMKKDPELKKIPVIILTTSTKDEDIAKSYLAGANCYVTKPVDFDQFQIVVKALSEFWFSIVKLPKE